MLPAMDMTQLKKAHTATPAECRALESFDKQGVIDAHAKLLESATEAQAFCEMTGSFCIVIPTSEFNKSSAPLPSQELNPVSLSELQPDKCHEGRVLHGVLCVKPLKLANLGVSVLEETGSGKAARVLLGRSLLYSSLQAEVEQLLPYGAHVMIREPCLVRNAPPKGTALMVSNPACFEIVSYYPCYSISAGYNEPAVLRGLGNKEFSARNYRGAIDLYTKLIDAAHGQAEPLLLAYSNRAEAWLKLGYAEKALQDADSALGFDGGHWKSLLRKGRALSNLCQYETAFGCFQQASKLAAALLWPLDQKREIEMTLKEALRWKEQSLHGTHDLSSYFLAGRVTDETFADFVGPVEIGMTPDGRGRGLFLTKDVHIGDLLLVCNAVGIVKEGKVHLEFDNSDILKEVVRACMASPRVYQQVSSMIGFGPSVVPPMEIFRPNLGVGNLVHKQELDVDAIERVLSEATDAVCDSLNPLLRNKVALWALPAFLNHSCLPNVSTLTVGKAMFVMASRDMAAGTELLRSYTDCLSPWYGMRKQNAFTCHCERCKLEARLEKPLEKLSRRYHELLEGVMLLGSSRELDQAFIQVAVELESKLNVLDLSAEEKHWLRAAHSVAYGTYYSRRPLLHISHENLPSALEIVDGLHKAAPGYCKTLLMMVSCFKYNNNGEVLKANQLIEEECVAACGHLPSEVRNTIIEYVKQGRLALLN